jgi:multiple sugar transport system permease protein/putative aldouronate transport system permease protein
MVTTTPTRRAVRRDADVSGRAVFAIVNYSVFLALAFVCAYPFYYLIINSISSNDLAALGEVRWLPTGIHFANYEQVFQLGGLTQAAIVSVGRTVLGTVAAVLASAFLGFMFTQSRMWGRKFWYRFVIITMYFSAGLIPVFIVIRSGRGALAGTVRIALPPFARHSRYLMFGRSPSASNTAVMPVLFTRFQLARMTFSFTPL